ncbi:MAG: hypothetical protein ACI84K_000097 [Pseudohongiellaceae bacterium]|jgi:hypothetical protein
MNRLYVKRYTCLEGIYRRVTVFIISLCAIVANANSELVFTGKAYSLDSEQLLYVERHSIKLNDLGEYLSSQVNYFDPEGQSIATKFLDFSDSQTMPKLSFVDKRINAKIEVQPFDKEQQHRVRILKERGDERKVSEVKTEDKYTSIIDAGFDLYVMANWQKLLDGGAIEMEFLALTRAKYIGFKLEPAHLEKNAKMGQLVLSLRPQNFFIRLLMEPIYLSYDINSKRLIRFEGLTNLEMVEQGQGLGDNFVARIEYSYP